MIRIDTAVESRSIEIDDKEYAIAPRTIEVCEKLLEAGKANVGKPAYRLKLAELEILLGKAAFKELFRRRDRENVDRIDTIYRGVSQAFTQHEEELQSADMDDRVARLSSALEPLNELLRNTRALNREQAAPQRAEIREIHRG